MRPPRLLFAALLAALSCPRTGAQAPVPSAPSAQDVENVLSQWERVKDGNEAARRSVVARLGKLDDPRVTGVLLAELERSQGWHATLVVRALGAQVRPEAFEPLGRLLLHAATPSSLGREVGAAIAAQGNRGVDLLLAILPDAKRATPAVRSACLHGLSRSGNDRALRALATMAVQGGNRQQREVLQLLQGVQNVPAVTRARLQLAGDSDLLLAAMAVRQLCEERYSRADDLAASVAERSGLDPEPAVRVQLLLGLVGLSEPLAWPLLLRMAASEAGVVRTAVRAAASTVAGNPALIEWLATKGLTTGGEGERDAALRLLREAPAESLRPLVTRVRERLRAPTRQDLELALGLHDLLAKDPTWTSEALALARASDPMLRTAGLDMLRELRAAVGLEVAQRSVDHREWEVRAAAIRFLGEVRAVSSIPVLITRVGKETGRLERELSDVLFSLAGRRLFERSAWEGWWRRSRDGFVLPSLETVSAQSSAGGGGGGATVSYFDIPLVSRKLAFLVDTSGSMAAKIGTDATRTRLDEAKNQLLRVVDALPEEHLCNVVLYQSNVRAVWPELRQVLPKNKGELRAAIQGLRPAGGTNIHDALEQAFRDPTVDTIYLLTDGQPSVGAIVNAQDLADEIRRWNRVRQIVIHGISIGIDSVLLKRLAAESGGEYRYVR